MHMFITLIVKPMIIDMGKSKKGQKVENYDFYCKF